MLHNTDYIAAQYCPNGTFEADPCPAGYYCPTPNEKIICPEHHFCKLGSIVARRKFIAVT